mgnify:FL=1
MRVSSSSAALLLLLLVVVAGAVCVHATIPFRYPLYKQCDSRWGDDVIETTTICKVGCLMSSVSMGLAGKNITIPPAHHESNPGTLNTWLRNNGGYTSGNDLIESVVPNINKGQIRWEGSILSHDGLTLAQIRKYLQDGSTVVIGNVMEGRHFVLIVGWDDANENELLINDPGFAVTQRSYSEFVGYRIFTMLDKHSV